MYCVFVFIIFYFITEKSNSKCMYAQARLIKGSSFVDEAVGHYKTLEELWDGEI